jgi:hypothetical protein
MAARMLVVKALDIVKAIRSGLNDEQLMDRFQISAHALQTVFTQLQDRRIISKQELAKRSQNAHSSVIVEVDRSKLPANPKKTVIDAAEAVKYIRSGMKEPELMRKFRLSSLGLESLKKKLLVIGAITPEEISNISDSKNSVIIEDEINPISSHSDRTVLSSNQRDCARRPPRDNLLIIDRELDSELHKLITSGCFDVVAHKDDGIHEYSIYRRDSRTLLHHGKASNIAEFVQTAVCDGVDLSGADLRGIDLSRIDLSGARFSNAILDGSCFVGTDLTGANLSGASLIGCNLFGACLYKSNFAHSNLSDANLSMTYAVWVFMQEVNLAEANLTDANMSGANLENAIFFKTILDGTNLNGAYIIGSNLDSGFDGKPVPDEKASPHHANRIR